MDGRGYQTGKEARGFRHRQDSRQGEESAAAMP